MLWNSEVHKHFTHMHQCAGKLIQKWESLKYNSDNTWQWQLCHRNAKECHAELHGAMSMDDCTLPYRVAVIAGTDSQSGRVSIADVHCSRCCKFTHTDMSVDKTEWCTSEARCRTLKELAKYTRIYISKMLQIVWQAFKWCKKTAKWVPHYWNELQQGLCYRTYI
jgi:hypothetical protein